MGVEVGNVRTKVLVSILALSCAMNVFLLYSVIDRSDALADHASQIGLRERQVRAAEPVFATLLEGQKSRDLLLAAKQANLQVLEKNQDEIWVGEVEFRSRGGELQSVDFH